MSVSGDRAARQERESAEVQRQATAARRELETERLHDGRKGYGYACVRRGRLKSDNRGSTKKT